MTHSVLDPAREQAPGDEGLLAAVPPTVPPATPTGVPAASTPRRRWRRPSWVVLLVAVLALAGITLLQLPGIATWFSQLEYSREIVGLNHSSTPEGDRGAELAAARTYNEGLTGAAVVAAGQRIPQAASGGPDSVYNSLLAADSTGLMARIKIPKIDVDLPVYHGTSDSVLLQGVGHLEGTALPVGGATTHTVLTGHRGLAQAEMFDDLDKVRIGDTFTIEVWGEVLTYRVRETQVVKPDDTQSLYPILGEDLATLVTCTPLGINSHRILVTGERVTPTPIADLESAGEDPVVPGFPWWAVWLAVAVVGVAGYVVLSCRTPGARRAAPGRGTSSVRPAPEPEPSPLPNDPIRP